MGYGISQTDGNTSKPRRQMVEPDSCRISETFANRCRIRSHRCGIRWVDHGIPSRPLFLFGRHVGWRGLGGSRQSPCPGSDFYCDLSPCGGLITSQWPPQNGALRRIVLKKSVFERPGRSAGTRRCPLPIKQMRKTIPGRPRECLKTTARTSSAYPCSSRQWRSARRSLTLRNAVALRWAEGRQRQCGGKD